MSISRRVSKAFKEMLDGDPEGALVQICSTIEVTAKREGYPEGKKGYKTITTAISIGPALSVLSMPYAHPKLKGAADGAYGIEEILYHAVRGSLYHTERLPSDFVITDNNIGPDESGVLQIHKALIVGLIVAVVASPVNAGLTTDPNYVFLASGKKFRLNEYWDKRDQTPRRIRGCSQIKNENGLPVRSVGYFRNKPIEPTIARTPAAISPTNCCC